MRAMRKISVAGIRLIALTVIVLAGTGLQGCNPATRAIDATQPYLPSGVARPATATAVSLAVGPALVEVTRVASEPAGLRSTPTAVAASLAVTDTAAGFPLLVLHSNDVRGYSLPCG
jgi:hypothetical protein